MDFGQIEDTLKRKYGPLPGYAWAGIGAGAIVLIAKLHKGAGSGKAGSVAVSPLSVGGASQGGGGGGGGGFDLPTDPALAPSGDGGVTSGSGDGGGSTGGSAGSTVASAPIGAAPALAMSSTMQVDTLPGHDPTIDQLVAPEFVPVSADTLPPPLPGTLAIDGGGLFTAPVNTQGVYDPAASTTALVDSSGHVVNEKGSRVGGATLDT